MTIYFNSDSFPTIFEVQFIKTHPNAVLPKRNHDLPGGIGDSGYDLTCCERTIVPARGNIVVPVGLKLAYVSPGIWFRIEARSGVGFKKKLYPHFGIIDNGYRGDLGVMMYSHNDEDVIFEVGDRIAQIVFYPLIDVKCSFSDRQIESQRGEKGFGSSDNK